ncbi:MAG: hypothetical protein IKW19_00770 [Akkermansia sp.]|nr:hypothetical protein [Akkermansia sp.]MBR5184806.1 hypothetical protein [Akkermansia sp.]
MKRLAFNGGEISPNMALRSDMDIYARSCTTLTNFDVHATGGISRRRGFSSFTETNVSSAKRKLIPYVYSDDHVYLIEAYTNSLVIYNSLTHERVKSLTDFQVYYAPDPEQITWQQINSILLLCTGQLDLVQLKLNDDLTWSLSRFEFKCPPWQTIDLRDREIHVSPDAPNKNKYTVTFDPDEDEIETTPSQNDLLRASYYVPRQETSQLSSAGIVVQDTPFDDNSKFSAGNILAVPNTIEKAYICVKDFTGSNDFVAGCTSPENYMADGDARFIEAEDLTGFDKVTAITALSSSTSYKKGDKLKLRTGYWNLYTCIRTFNWSTDKKDSANWPADYPSHFISGAPVGSALTCRGAWKFHCSGTWYGHYEIRRCYDTPELSGLWQTLGESISPIGSPVNNIITGDESGEECYLRLFLTRSRYLGADIASGWPSSSCGNSLIVSTYKHDMQLKYTYTTSNKYTDVSPIQPEHRIPFATKDWSWEAFTFRFGLPKLATIHESRLVLASTKAQPQTIWMSCTDDLNNFQTGSLDTSALHLTMSTTTQAHICWLLSRGEVIMLGTEDAEWVISSSNGSSLTPTSARIVNHGRVGSAHIPAVQAIDRVLYCERGSGRVYQYGFDWNSNSYISTDLTIFADHIASLGHGIVSGTVQRKPYTRAIFVLADGTLALMTYNTLHQVHAWHRYTTNGKFESVCALPNGTKADKIYAIVLRGSKRYLECMADNSPYYDAEEEDYTSTVETTAFTVPDANEPKRHQAQLKVFITTPTPASAITARTASANYSPISYTGDITPGWVKLCTLSGWSDRPLVGLRVTGPNPAEILAMQVE